MKSRREFTRSILGTSSGILTLSWAEQAFPREAWPNFSFVIVSDTHVGRKGISAEKQWRKTASELQTAKGEFILHLGDVINAGLVEQYAIYKDIRDTIGKPVHEIPGNHDPLAEFEGNLGIKADRSFDHQGVRFVLFNNAQEDSHDGFVEESQLAWLAKEFSTAKERNLRIIICAHVPFHFNRPPDRAWYVKPESGQTEFYELVDQYSDRILAIFHGHFHNGIRGWEDRAPVHEVLMPSALYNQKRSLMENGAPGYHLAETRPGYVLAKFRERQLRLTYQITGTEENIRKDLPY